MRFTREQYRIEVRVPDMRVASSFFPYFCPMINDVYRLYSPTPVKRRHALMNKVVSLGGRKLTISLSVSFAKERIPGLVGL